MENLLATQYSPEQDAALLQEALGGSKIALEKLIKRHYGYIYNLALRFVLRPADAEDLTQEVCIKVFTKLRQFDQKSEFRTWLYRIVFNHFLNSKRRKTEQTVSSFEKYGEGLENPLEELSDQESLEWKEVIEDYKIWCMTGMLLCLSRKQRLVFILGEFFEVNSQTGAKVLEISPENYRKILSRARKDLYHFMNHKCGLLRPENPCRCPAKTKEQILEGRINPQNIQFNKGFVNRVSDYAFERVNQSESLVEEKYARLFKDHPYYQMDKSLDILTSLSQDEDLKSIFNLH